MFKIHYLALLLVVTLGYSQEIFTNFLVENGDTLDVFSYQIPENYDNLDSHPLLVAFHQWGGNENSTYYYNFDDEANSRSWIFLSPFGGAVNNYNHQGAQYFVQQEILWLINEYNIDSRRIYMVGGSMGGAAGAIFANNHLDPTLPMVAASASASGILDCERRYYEMDGNNSMIEWFGGTPEEVPFEYHRNSAVFFTDSSQSPHYNLQYTPLYLDFGSTEPHRYHAEDLYNLLQGYNLNMWIDIEPSGGHGYPVIDENDACNWLSQFTLVDDPIYVNANLDEPSRAYWFEALNQTNEDEFIRLVAGRDSLGIFIGEFQNSDSLLVYLPDEFINGFSFYIGEDEPFTIGFTAEELEYATGVTLYYFGEPTFGANLQNNTIWIEVVGWGDYTLWISYVFEDVNLDGVWDVTDIVLTVQYILGQVELEAEQVENADLNDDSYVDILDIIAIINLILG